jgi:DNA-binding NarL/FixJ family response regulator
MIRVFVVARTPMMRVGLSTILTHRDMQVVGEAAILAKPAAELSGIDVIVLGDDELLEDIQRLLAEGTAPALVVLSSNTNRLPHMLNSLSPQGWGVVQQDASTAQLQAAVMAAAQGLRVIPNIHNPQWDNHASLPGRREAGEHEGRPSVTGDFGSVEVDAPLPDEALTAREREVLELLSRGLPNKLIARRLQISEHTVKFHVSAIYAKLGASSRTDAVSRGVRRGLITL